MPLTILTDNSEGGARLARRRSALHIGQTFKFRCMEKQKRCSQEIEEHDGLGKQLVARHVKAHVTGENRRQNKNELKFTTERNATADQLANLGADTGKAGGAEWPASDLQKVKKKKKKTVTSAVHFHKE